MLYEFKEADAYAFARHVGIRAKQRGHNLHFQTCPYCRSAKDKDTFAIDLETGQFKCLRASCGVSGNMIQLSRDFDFSLGYTVDEYYRPKKKYKRLPTPKEPIVPRDKAVAYLESRGISAEVAKRYEITVHARHENTLVFPFFDEKGILQTIKYRDTEHFPGKKFTDKDGKERKSPKEWIEEDCRPILFGMKQCNDKFDRLVVTEGQLDSLSAATASIENAVSVPNGSQGMTWIPYCFNWVSKFDEIVVFGDFEKGRMTLLADFQKRFPNKIKHVREQDYRECKDANELLQNHGKDAVRQAVENAVPAPVNRVLPLAEVESVNIYELPKLKTGISQLDRTLYGGLPFGMVCIIAGKRGDGKSTLASQIMANAVEQDLYTFAYSGELPNYLYKSWFDFQVAGRNHIVENQTEYGTVNRFITNKNQELINAWYADKAYIYDNRIIDGDEKEDLLKSVEQAIMQYGIKVVLIDNLMTAMYIDELQGSDKYDQQGRFVRELTKIAIRYDVLILLVAHRRKNNFTSDANDEISGSGDITNLAGITLSYDRGSKDEIDKGVMEESQRKLIVAKNRLFGKIDLKGLILSYDEKSKRIYGNGDDVNKQFGWDKSDGFTGADNMEIPFD
ncbi:AAA family ATPase [Blautia coccoides]|uniref:AAA family ATPase n=1 Tax=Blautia producta TaxID=33035 RepID=UPI0028A475AB|nr:AAA family ATPase [Blautia coccoides]MDT4377256.1 AAA family ATPase [Blautia coccoides]